MYEKEAGIGLFKNYLKNYKVMCKMMMTSQDTTNTFCIQGSITAQLTSSRMKWTFYIKITDD